MTKDTKLSLLIGLAMLFSSKAFADWVPYWGGCADPGGAEQVIFERCVLGGYICRVVPTDGVQCQHDNTMIQVWSGSADPCQYPSEWDPIAGQCGLGKKNYGCQNPVLNPINAGLGNKIHYDLDVSAGIELLRGYNSRYVDGWNSMDMPFGWNWRSNHHRRINLRYSEASVYLPDGRGLTFFYDSTSTSWQSDIDSPFQLERLSDETWMLIDRFTGDSEKYNQDGSLQRVTKLSGYRLNYAYSDGSSGPEGGVVHDADGNPTESVLPPGMLLQVVDSYSRKIEFKYGPGYQVVIAKINEFVMYRYKYSNGNLVEVSFPDGSAKKYLYGEPANVQGTSNHNFRLLTGIVDENGDRYSTYKYDLSGRAIFSEHAGGADKGEIAYTLDPSGIVMSAEVKDAKSTITTHEFTSTLGVMKKTGGARFCPNCGGESSSAYDASGNVISRTDFSGHTTNYVYDQARNLEMTRTEAVGTSTERVITKTWHPTYRLPMTIIESGRVTSFNYDANGNLLSQSVASVP